MKVPFSSTDLTQNDSNAIDWNIMLFLIATKLAGAILVTCCKDLIDR